MGSKQKCLLVPCFPFPQNSLCAMIYSFPIIKKQGEGRKKTDNMNYCCLILPNTIKKKSDF